MAVAYSTNGSTARNGQLSMFFIVKRSGTSAELQSTTSVDFETADVTAVAGKDYTATSGQLTFASGVTEQTVSVALLDAAYDNSAAVTFVFALPGYASVGATIDPTSDGQSVQAYLIIPDTSTTEQVPTTDLITGKTSAAAYQNIKYQTDYENLGDGDNANIDKPFAYLRLGYTRGDMNDYERVIANSDEFQPKWMGKGSGGEPREIGPLATRMVPRGIDRKKDPGAYGASLKQLEKNNANLDGVFLYSAQNYIVTVGRHLNEVIQGDHVEYVGGHLALVAMQGHSTWTYYGGSLRSATGLDKVNGEYWHYDIKDAKELKISTSTSIEYSLDVVYDVSASVRMIVDNSFKYRVTNGIEMNVSGLSAVIDGDVFGFFGIKLAGSYQVSNAFAIHHIAMSNLRLQVNPALWTAAAYGVSRSSLALAAAAAAATTPAWISNFQSGKQFFNDSNSEELGSKYAKTFSTALPATMGALAAVNAAITVAAAAQQAMGSLVALTPTIDLTPATLTLMCGASSIVMTNASITITSPAVALNGTVTTNISGGSFSVNSTVRASIIGGTSVALTAPTSTRVTGPLQVAGAINATGAIQALQVLA